VVDVVGRAWNLAEIGRAYDEFVATYRPLVSAVTGRSTDEEAYAARFALVRSWRTVGGRDPHLPAALLPTPWPGAGAAGFFDRHAARLRPAAERFVERCLASAARGIRVGFSEP
jgi:phenylacetic acid degradation operon negative regulatory protein